MATVLAMSLRFNHPPSLLITENSFRWMLWFASSGAATADRRMYREFASESAMGGATPSSFLGDDMECTVGNTWTKTCCIFTYDGSTKDVLLNYFIFLVNLAYCTAALWKSGKHRQRLALYCLLGVAAFQWTLCLVVGCSGISIIWCAMCGWTMNERRQRLQGDWEGSTSTNLLQDRRYDYGTGVIFLNIVAIGYYAFVMAPITTVAHVCALILGASLNIIALSRTQGGPRGATGHQEASTSSNAPLLQGDPTAPSGESM